MDDPEFPRHEFSIPPTPPPDLISSFASWSAGSRQKSVENLQKIHRLQKPYRSSCIDNSSDTGTPSAWAKKGWPRSPLSLQLKAFKIDERGTDVARKNFDKNIFTAILFRGSGRYEKIEAGTNRTVINTLPFVRPSSTSDLTRLLLPALVGTYLIWVTCTSGTRSRPIDGLPLSFFEYLRP